MEILFEDNSVIVCVKPQGVLSQQGRDGEKDMLTLLSSHCGCEVYPVHRLDKDVGGVMVYAKTKSAAAELSAQVSDRRMEKIYLAVAPASEEYSEGTMEDLLYFDRQKNKSFTVKRERRGVKRALLEYVSEKNSGGFALYRVKLHTGRTHQIRVQFASRKIPLLGDRKYGGAQNECIALWSHKISFMHPETKDRMSFQAQSDEECFKKFY